LVTTAEPLARLRAKLVLVLLALDRLTVNTASAPSSTVTLLTAGSVALPTCVMVGAPSLSAMVPVPVTLPICSVKFSAGSLVVSLTVGTVTVKLVTPAGTITWPLTRVTPPLKVMALV
jgi:hypothetical protein